MARLPVIAAAVLAIAASAPVDFYDNKPSVGSGMARQRWRYGPRSARSHQGQDTDAARFAGAYRPCAKTGCKTGKIYGVASASASASGETERTTTMMEAGAEACAGGSPSASPRGAVVARRATVISSPGACGTRTGIFLSSFAGACVATRAWPEAACSDLIGLGAGVR